MVDPLRHDTAQAESSDRNIKTEQLLVLGLDHYFAGEYEQAIDVWTRVLFFDRGHARARAYIERARSALAEGQREADELLHDGVGAYRRGEIETARRLLMAGIDRGVPNEEALAVLARIDRLSPSPAESRRRDRTALRTGHPPARGSRRRGVTSVWIVSMLMLLTIALGGLLVAMSWSEIEPLIGARRSVPVVAPAAVPEDPLVVPSAAEVTIGRARTLFRRGHLGEALRLLDAVRPSGALRVQADQLRSDIQRTLLTGVAPAFQDRQAPRSAGATNPR